MKAKPEVTSNDKKPFASNRKGEKRDKAIQIRVFQKEKLQIKATHGRGAPAVARAFLLGSPAPKMTALEDPGKRQVMHALHAHFVEVKRTRRIATEGDSADLHAQLENQEKTLTQLLRICFSSFSR
ncbi:MAG: hypothetical protein MUF13_14420 [Akkermansiaceae bacterium]|jgi:hypothetical protein|nr:hypothetical protein [Akkermansiaceae bacterium]